MTGWLRRVDQALAWPLVVLLRVYRLLISPLYGQTCRFYPSCSAYAVEALERRGLVNGVRLTVWRLLRCNPWNDGGVDLVPMRRAVPSPDGEVPAVTGQLPHADGTCHSDGEPVVRHAA